MPGDDFRVLVANRKQQIQRVDRAEIAATVVHIDVRVRRRPVNIARMHRVRAHEFNKDIAVRVCIGHLEDVHSFTIDMKSELIVEGHQWWLFRVARNRHLCTNIIVTENRCTHAAKIFVAAGMIRVHMRIDEEPDGRIRDIANRVHDLVGQRRVLIIDQENAGCADEKSDISTAAFNLADVASHRMNRHNNVVEILCP